MTTDEAFDKAYLLLEKAAEIWQNKDTEKYSHAERCFKEGVSIYNEYFSDNKKVLTEEENPF